MMMMMMMIFSDLVYILKMIGPNGSLSDDDDDNDDYDNDDYDDDDYDDDDDCFRLSKRF